MAVFMVIIIVCLSFQSNPVTCQKVKYLGWDDKKPNTRWWPALKNYVRLATCRVLQMWAEYLRIRPSQNTLGGASVLGKGGEAEEEKAGWRQQRLEWHTHKPMGLEPADRGRGKEGFSPSTLSPADVWVSDSSL